MYIYYTYLYIYIYTYIYIHIYISHMYIYILYTYIWLFTLAPFLPDAGTSCKLICTSLKCHKRKKGGDSHQQRHTLLQRQVVAGVFKSDVSDISHIPLRVNWPW